MDKIPPRLLFLGLFLSSAPVLTVHARSMSVPSNGVSSSGVSSNGVSGTAVHARSVSSNGVCGGHGLPLSVEPWDELWNQGSSVNGHPLPSNGKSHGMKTPSWAKNAWRCLWGRPPAQPPQTTLSQRRPRARSCGLQQRTRACRSAATRQSGVSAAESAYQLFRMEKGIWEHVSVICPAPLTIFAACL